MASHTWNMIFLQDSVANPPPPWINFPRGSSWAFLCSRKGAFPKGDMQVTKTKTMGSYSPKPIANFINGEGNTASESTDSSWLSPLVLLYNLPQRWGCW